MSKLKYAACRTVGTSEQHDSHLLKVKVLSYKVLKKKKIHTLNLVTLRKVYQIGATTFCM